MPWKTPQVAASPVSVCSHGARAEAACNYRIASGSLCIVLHVVARDALLTPSEHTWGQPARALCDLPETPSGVVVTSCASSRHRAHDASPIEVIQHAPPLLGRFSHATRSMAGQARARASPHDAPTSVDRTTSFTPRLAAKSATWSMTCRRRTQRQRSGSFMSAPDFLGTCAPLRGETHTHTDEEPAAACSGLCASAVEMPLDKCLAYRTPPLGGGAPVRPIAQHARSHTTKACQGGGRERNHVNAPDKTSVAHVHSDRC